MTCIHFLLHFYFPSVSDDAAKISKKIMICDQKFPKTLFTYPTEAMELPTVEEGCRRGDGIIVYRSLNGSDEADFEKIFKRELI